MTIHFVCRGNTHRSRLAEAYAKSLVQDNPTFHIISSGIEAARNLNGSIMPFVKHLLEENDLLRFTGPTWTQTTQKLVDDSNVIIFMNDDVYKDASKFLKIPSEKSQIWQIPDAQGAFRQIKLDVNMLLKQLNI